MPALVLGAVIAGLVIMRPTRAGPRKLLELTAHSAAAAAALVWAAQASALRSAAGVCPRLAADDAAEVALIGEAEIGGQPREERSPPARRSSAARTRSRIRWRESV